MLSMLQSIKQTFGACAELNNDLRPVAQGELEEVPLLCQPYVRQNGNPNGELVPNNETTNGCVQLTAANIEAEYGGLVCPNAEVTEVNQNDPAWLVCFPSQYEIHT